MKKLAIVLLLPFFTGCAALTSSAPESWVRTDRARYKSIGTEYLAYVDGDTTLEQRQKDIRHHNVEAWDADLREHETTLAQTQPAK